MKTLHALILAAGYGERLRPITDHIPKPLLPVLGKPVIEIVLEKIASLPVDSIGINTHHKSEMLIQWLDSSPYSGEIKLFHEKAILGTGGAIKNAAEFLAGSVFIVHNSDILSDINLQTLVEEHFSSGSTATLAVHDFEKFNNIWVDSSGILKHIEKAGAEQQAMLCKMAFTGIAVYSPDFLDFLPEGNSSVVDAWMRALASGKKIGTVDFSGCLWSDIGTPAAYFSAVQEALKKSGETLYVHSSADCSKAEIEGYAAFEKGCVIGSGTYLKNCVVLPDAQVSDGSSIEDAVVGPDYILRLEKSEGEVPDDVSEAMVERIFQRPLKYLNCSLIGTGGSDRKYYRLNDQNTSSVLMVCAADDPDYERHIVYTEFFRRHSLPVPELFDTDRERKQAVFEDLGDRSLYAWLKCRRDPERIEAIYRKVLDISVRLHTDVSRHAAECQLLASRVFDYEHLRWETSYFMERFVSDYMGMTIQDGHALKEEFQVLAETADSFPKAIVHRDFQSQNLMIAKGEIPRVIDFQGARIGPPAYDIASLLWDPYYRLDEDMRERLVCYYMKKMRADSADDFFQDEFRYSLHLCRLQRHMQALGAYGFLSGMKGKRYFLKHIPQAMEYLTEEICESGQDFPVLHGLITKLHELYHREISGRWKN